MNIKLIFHFPNLLIGRRDLVRKTVCATFLLISFIYFQRSYGNQIKFAQIQTVQHGMKIHLKFNEAKPGDTLVLTLINIMMPFKDKQFRSTVNNNGEFSFDVITNLQFGYFKIGRIDHRYDAIASGNIRDLTIPFFWEIGDEVKLVLSNKETQAGISSKYSFSGKGANKYNIRAKVFDDSLYKNQSLINNDKTIFNKKMQYNSSQKYFDDFRISEVNKEREQITDLSYNTLKADILYQYGAAMYYDIVKFYQKSINGLNSIVKDSILNLYNLNFANVVNYGVTEKGLANSLNAVSYLNYKFRANSYIRNGSIDLLYVYNQIKGKTSGELRDRLTLYYLKFSRNSPSVDSIFEDSKSIILSTTAKKELLELEPIFSKGKHIKDYKFYDKNGQSVNLGLYKNKVILIDFWSTGCGPCASFYQNTLAKVERHFEKDGEVAFISVCLDINKERWLKSIKSGLYTSVDAINVYTGGTGVNHPITNDFNIRIYPVVMLINSKGNVGYFNTENLYKMDTLIVAINNSK